jgi:hypothetical protein
MRRRIEPLRNKNSGRADPFGLLVLAVLLAVSLTMVVQAQWPDPAGAPTPATTATAWAVATISGR